MENGKIGKEEENMCRLLKFLMANDFINKDIIDKFTKKYHTTISKKKKI
jgi:hypothetical protein